MTTNRPRSAGHVGARVLTLLSLFAVLTQVANAQDMDVRVSYQSGAFWYLDVGLDEGFQAADTLHVYDGGLRIGSLVIAGILSKRSVTEMGDPFPIAVGDVVTIKRPRPVPVNTDTDTPPERPTRTPSLLTSTSLNSRSESVSPRQRVQVSGRLRAGVSMLQSTTRWRTNTDQEAVRTFATPAISGRLAIKNLPGGGTAVLRFSAANRYNSVTGSEPLVRLQQASIVRPLRGRLGQLETGRFMLREDPGHTYWDGIRAVFSARSIEGGVAVGFEPDRFNGSVQTTIPKVAAFLKSRYAVGSVKSTTSVTGVFVQPGAGGTQHAYLGLEQDFRVGRLRWSSGAQIDGNPGGGLFLSRIQSNVVIPVTTDVTLRGRVSSRKPFSHWRASGAVGTRRNRQSVGLAWRRNRVSASVDATFTQAAAGVRGTSLTTGLGTTNTGVLGIGMSATAGRWEGGGTATAFGSLTLNRRVFGLRTRAGYRVNQVSGRAAASMSHAFSLSLSGRLSRQFEFSTMLRTQLGSQLRSNSLNFSIAYRF